MYAGHLRLILVLSETRCCVSSSSPQLSIMSHFNPVHIGTPCSLKTHFRLVLRKCLAQISASTPTSPGISFRGFPQPLQENAATVSLPDYGWFLSNPFQFVNQSSCPAIVYIKHTHTRVRHHRSKSLPFGLATNMLSNPHIFPASPPTRAYRPALRQ
jgi:hypothetical protein